jgi:hypothetical protein
VNLFAHAQHVMDQLEIEACPIQEPDGIDFVHLESGRVYMRANSAGRTVVSYQVANPGELRRMAASTAQVADMWEQLQRRRR